MDYINYTLFGTSVLVILVIVIIFFLAPRKSYIPIKRQSLPNHVERGFFSALTRSSKEHGYTGIFGPLLFFIKRLRDHVYQVLSRIVPWSGLE